MAEELTTKARVIGSETKTIGKEDKKHNAREKLKELFDSALWHYPVHQFGADIVQKNQFEIDYDFDYHVILFELYCDLVAYCIDDAEYDVSEIIATGVLDVLPSSEAIKRGRARACTPDPNTLVSEADAVYLFATYSLESFEFLLRSYTIGLKENCFSYMEGKMRKLVICLTHSPINVYLATNVNEKLHEKVREFSGRQAANLFTEQKKTIGRIDKLLANKHLIGLKNTIRAAASFILSQEIDPESMPSMPRNSDFWEEYLQQAYSARLSSVLSKEKGQFEQDELHEKLKSKFLGHLVALNKFLNSPAEHPRRHPFPSCIIRLRKVISTTVSETLY